MRIVALCLFVALMLTASEAGRQTNVGGLAIKSAQHKLKRAKTKSITKKNTEFVAATTTIADSKGIPDSMKLVIGAGGIYGAFLYYGAMQEAVFTYEGKHGNKFKAAWFLQAVEALANVVVGAAGLYVTGGATKGLPLKTFMMGGTSQVCAKACTSLALASGLSFPVVTLAKSGKMIPVMIGSILLGGSRYTLREYLQVLSIILGTMMVSMGKKKGAGSSSTAGLVYITLSLALDGVTGGLQNRLKAESKARGLRPKPYDFMFWTNLFMAAIALMVSLVNGQLFSGLSYMNENPSIALAIMKFAACSAIGQSFVFYTISNFDSLVCTTVTTTRKIFSVLLSIFLNGHPMSAQGWTGIGVASLGILAEIQNKSGKKH